MASGFVTKEIESRLRQSPEHLFEVFLEIQEPANQEPPEILIKYPDDFSDSILKTAATFAYPCQIPPDDQSEHFTFVVLDSTGSIFRFGYCRRSNRESTCLCLISYYPWFEVFYNVLNDLSQIINSKSTSEMETFLSALYNYKPLSTEDLTNNSGKEIIEITLPSNLYSYSRPDLRKLPSIPSNSNFSVMFSRLGPENMLRLFAHLLLERRILFISAKLFHLTACVCGCLHLINPMHWQNIFLPILPESMAWTAQCTAPFLIGVHSSIYSQMNRAELGDVIVVNVDNRTIESPYDDLSSFPKQWLRQMKKDIQQSAQLPGDNLARVFLRTMAFLIGNYTSGFIMKNEMLDFDRDVYLNQYQGTDLHAFMTSVVNTQMFEQFSRYRTYVAAGHPVETDEFDLEVKNVEHIRQSTKAKTNKRIYKMLEKNAKESNRYRTVAYTSDRSVLIDEGNKATNPLIEQVQSKAEKLQTVINRAGHKVVSEASAVKNNLTSFDMNDLIKRANDDTIESGHRAISQSNAPNVPSSASSIPELDHPKTESLINFDTDENSLLLPAPIVLEVVQKPLAPEASRPPPQIDSKIKRLQSELQYKVQTFDAKRLNPQEEYGHEQTEIKKLVQQFDPLDGSNSVLLRSEASTSDRPSSLDEIIPSNCVHNVLRNIQSTYGTNTRMNLKITDPVQQVSHSSSASDFDPLASAATSLHPHLPSTDVNGSNLIDFN